MNDRQKQGIALVLTGTVLAALAIHPPKMLTAVYLAFERAVAACAGVLLAAAGAAALLGLDAPHTGKAPDYTIDYDDAEGEL